MNIEYNKSLKEYNTFGIDVTASEFIEICSEKYLIDTLIENQKKDLFILSGGSNILLTKNIDSLVLYIAIKGVTTKYQSENSVLVSACAGENWHDLVLYCIKNNYGGLENLSLIPGYVGSAPIQNIGAYGVELKDSFVNCEAINIETREKKVFTKKDCEFGYRNSIFKNKVKGKFIITKVTFKLTSKNHTINSSYGAIEKALSEKKIQHLLLKIYLTL